LTIKKIAFLTGTRADFGKLQPLIEIIEKSDNFKCYIFVTGMHTLSKYGSTYKEVKKQKYKNIFIFMNQTNSTDQDIILANTITGFSNFIKEVSPDLIVVHGDRIEALAGAIVGSFNNILVSHIEGGEISGTLDELIRHAITKLSHIHFVANEEAQNRLIQMGEAKNSCFVIGSPDIQIMQSSALPEIQSVKNYYEILFEKYSICIFHPVATEIDNLTNQVRELVSALINSNKNYIVVYPNNDAGSDIILNEYNKLNNNKNFKLFPSIRFKNFLSLLKNSEFIIGNSSVGVRESEVFGIPTINLGSRQKNRSKNKNIINIELEKNKIQKAIDKLYNKTFEPTSSFGDDHNTVDEFYQILSNPEIWNISLQKQFIDRI
tara:strand:+ start:596 stop:1726 length:1131 start_codon:yes stop_codon:yes gene_type:complete